MMMSETGEVSQTVPSHMAAQSEPLKDTWPGTHKFLCNGRIMVGPDIGVTAFAAILTTGVSLAFWLLVCPSLPLGVLLGGIALYGIVMLFMVLTSTSDPGIVPHNSLLDDAEATASMQQPNEVEINGVSVTLKWCRTCRIWRPPRASHCSECNVCVDKFDHHCPWMGQCIGRRNYRFFLGFVFSLIALCAYTAAFSFVALLQVLASVKLKVLVELVSKAFQRAPATCTLLIFPALVLLCVCPLGIYHSSLVCANRTTNEEIKGLHAARNPFTRGWRRNCHEACCEPRDVSRVHPRAADGSEAMLQAAAIDRSIDPLTSDASSDHNV